jgi:acyl-CoA reductase-like NAD-dependent aldehyde dehydrogenase
MAKSIKNTAQENRLPVLKTYKIYIGGQFPRTESGRYYIATNAKKEHLANICLSSRKDFRDAVVSARNAFGGWSARSAFNRGQILYRIGEMLEGRKAQFIEELILQGYDKNKAENEVHTAIDRLIYYSGWCDKFQQLYSSVNPVASSHFNFSAPEPSGVVAILAPADDALIGLVSLMAATIAGGNSCIILAGQSHPLCAVTFAEVLNSSDLPGGVVNILTGDSKELAPYFADHMDVNTVLVCDKDVSLQQMIREKAAQNLKRVFIYDQVNWLTEQGQSPYYIMDSQEIKTTWHPIENIGGAKAGY